MPPFGKWNPAFYLEAIARQAIITAIPRPKQENRLEAARKRAQSLHSYDTPQWIEVEVAKVDEKYLNWVEEASNLCGFHQKEPILKAMSQHPSYKSSSSSAVKRNVLKRFERVELLRKRGEWKEGDRVVGLKKTKPSE